MGTVTRPTPEQRLDRWLDEMAERDEIPPEGRDKYVATMRRSALAQHVLLNFTVRELGHQIASTFPAKMARLSKAARSRT
jgi:hypothetical protein